MTQLEKARNGIITEQMQQVAESEHRDPEMVRQGVAEGTIVIPYNKNRNLRKAIGFGKNLSTKVSASIGTGKSTPNVEYELEKLQVAEKAGTHSIMDLSLGGDLTAIRNKVLTSTDLPVGTLPPYQTFMEASSSSGILGIKEDDFIKQIRLQAEQGVDFMAFHSAMTRQTLEVAKRQGRVNDLASWGGSLLAGWMLHHDKENPFYTRFEEILAICKEHDVTLALADGLRPGCIADSLDRSQIQELIILGEQVDAARDYGVQIMIKGPGHAPIPHLEPTVQVMKQLCKGAPYFIFGPIATDVVPGYDHITAAIGASFSAAAGADFICYVTPAEHVRFPTAQDVHDGVIAARIAAHCGDLAKGFKEAWDWDLAMSKARLPWDIPAQRQLAMDPTQLEQESDEASMEGEYYCNRCGEKCAMKVIGKFFNRKIQYC